MTHNELIGFLSELPWAEIATRAVLTAFVVLVVALVVGKLGPIAGGLVAGLPMGFAPGFFFLIATENSSSLYEIGSHALLAVCATQVFLFSYMVACRFSTPAITLLVSVLVWAATIYALNLVNLNVSGTLAIFATITLATRKLGKNLCLNDVTSERSESFALLVIRACLGGILVAIVTVFAPKLGGALSGILLAFPIGFALICLTTHEQYGPEILIKFAHSALLGAISLAMFCFGFTVAVVAVQPYSALMFGLIASLATTGLLMFKAAFAKRRSSIVHHST